MATKKCPHCGNEIQSEAKKCRYCKQWLTDTEQSSITELQQTDVSSDNGSFMAYEDKPTEEVSRNRHRKGCIISVIVFLVLAFFLCPSEREHQQEIKSHLIEFARTTASEKLQDEMESSGDLFGLGNLLGNIFIKSDALMETVINNYVTIGSDSYGLFSLGFIGEKDSDERKLVSIGFMGKVFFLADLEDFKKNIE